MKRLLFLLVLTAVASCFPTAGRLMAQSSSIPHFSISGRAHLGFLIPHRNGLEALVKGHIKGIELDVEKFGTGRGRWEQDFRNPSTGAVLLQLDLGNQSQLGDATALFLYYRFPVITGKKIHLDYRIGAGLGYLSKRFERVENFKNIAIGSHFNATINMLGELEYEASSRISFKAGLAFTHFSNGAYKLPNLGINLVSANTGLSYTFGEPVKKEPKTVSDKLPKDQTWQAYVVGIGGIKEITPLGRKYLSTAVAFDFARNFSPKHHLILGLDGVYNSSLPDRARGDSVEVFTGLKNVQLGVKAMYHINVGRMAIMMGQGIYLLSRYNGDGSFYHRIGVRYGFTERLLGNISLKTHFFKADYFEFGLGYRLW